MRFDWSVKTTYDPRKDNIDSFDYRTTITAPCDGEVINWNTSDLFECGEEWRGREEIELDKVEDMVVTILERRP